MTRINRGPRRQRGAALLLLMLGVIIATAAVLVTGFSPDRLQTRKQQATMKTLAEVRRALLDYATISPELAAGSTFGLPCPDLDGTGGFAEGEAHTGACGPAGETVLGRVPWRTLGLLPPKDAASECAWYVVSGSWKHAGAATAEMINADTNGQLQLASVDSGALVAGALPQDRPVAAVIAALEPIDGQARPAAASGMQCSPAIDPGDYLEGDAFSGSSNAQLAGVPHAIDVLGQAAEPNELHNDRVLLITRSDIEARLYARAGFEAEIRALGVAAASCIADYAARNPGGGNDRRMPWPAAVALSDYRTDTAYDDVPGGILAGRLPDVVDDSSSFTSNPLTRVLSDCDSVAVPAWTAEVRARWQRWKDHFFYAVAGSFAPDAAVPSNCTDCLSVNGAGSYAAILIFANRRLSDLSQVRNAPPLDADTKLVTSNYLEGANTSNVPGNGVLRDYVSQAASTTFNDVLFCIDDNLVVSEC